MNQDQDSFADSHDEEEILLESIDQSQQFYALSAYIAELTAQGAIDNGLTEEQNEKLKELVNDLVAFIGEVSNGSPRKNMNPTSMNSVFKLLSYSIELLKKQASEGTYDYNDEKVQALHDENEELKKLLQEANNANLEMLHHISSEIGAAPKDTASELINFINDRFSQSNELADEIIDAFNLPEDTLPCLIVKKLKDVMRQQVTEMSMEKIEETDGEALRREVIRLTAIIDELQEENQAKDNALALNDRKIEELEAKLAGIQEHIVSPENFDAISQQNQNGIMNAQVENLKADVVTVKLENADLRRKYDKSRKIREDLAEKAGAAEKENAEIKAALEQAKAEISELKDKLEVAGDHTALDNQIEDLKKRLSKSESERSDYLSLIDELSSQFEAQAAELSEESHNRVALISAVQKLSILNQELEANLEKEHTAATQLDEKVRQQQKKIAFTKTGRNDTAVFSSLLDSILDITANTGNSVSQAVRDIIVGDESEPSDKILEVITKLTNATLCNVKGEAEEVRSLKRQNQVLSSAFRSLHKFVEQLTNSGNIETWVPNAEDADDARRRLLVQATRINNFITENAASLAEESTFFDYLMLDTSVTSFQNKMTEFLDGHDEIATGEGKELFTLLVLSLTANDILRKFATEAKLQCAHQVSDLKVIKNEAAIARRELEGQYYDELVALQAKLQDQTDRNAHLTESVERVKTILQQAATKDGGDISTILECIQDVNKATPELEENAYISELEKILESKNKDIQEMKETYDAERKDLLRQIADIQSEMDEVEAANAEREAEQLRNIEQITNDLHASEELVKELQDERAQAAQLAEQATAQHVAAIGELRQQIDEFEAKMASIKKQHTKEIQEATATRDQAICELEDQLASIQQQLQHVKSVMKKKLSKARAQLVLEEQRGTEDRAKAEEQIASLQESITSQVSSIASLNDEIAELKEALKESEEGKGKLQVEIKLLQTRLLSKEEKIKRDHSIFESQMKLKLFALETDAQAKIDAFRIESNCRLNDFLNWIVSTFSELVPSDPVCPHQKCEKCGQCLECGICSRCGNCIGEVEKGVDKNKPVDIESATALLESVRDKLIDAESLNQLLESARQEIKAVKAALGAPKNAKATVFASEVIHKMKGLEEEVDRLVEENKHMKKDIIAARSVSQQERLNKEWEEWARKLHLLVSDGFCSVKSAKDIRYAVEELVFASVGNRLVWRRLDLLRAEKKLILAGAHTIKPKQTPANFTHLATIARAIQRLQIMSGHAKSALTFERCSDRAAADPNTPGAASKCGQKGEKPKAPLFSKFVINQKNENVTHNI